MEGDVERDVDRTTMGKRILNGPVLLLVNNGAAEIENSSNSKIPEVGKPLKTMESIPNVPESLFCLLLLNTCLVSFCSFSPRPQGSGHKEHVT